MNIHSRHSIRIHICKVRLLTLQFLFYLEYEKFSNMYGYSNVYNVYVILICWSMIDVANAKDTKCFEGKLNYNFLSWPKFTFAVKLAVACIRCNLKNLKWQAHDP